MIWALVLAVMAALLGAAIALARRNGRQAAELEQARAAVEVKDAQLRIAADRPAGRDAILERMRAGDL